MELQAVSILLLAIATAVSSKNLNFIPNTIERNLLTIEEAPWQVSIQTHGVHFCGGAILNEEWIITSAQCIIDNTVSTSVKIHAGSSNRYYNGSTHSINRQIRHGSFKFNECKIPIYDIGLIKLQDKLIFDETRQPIKLSRGNLIPDKKRVEVTAWNDYFNDDRFSVYIEKNDWEIISETDCGSYYYFLNKIPPGVMCGVNTNNLVNNPCIVNEVGDPMIVNGYLVGIKSWKPDCYIFPDAPALYTNITSHLDWIKSTTGIIPMEKKLLPKQTEDDYYQVIRF
ncbi:hypodermin-B-like isoform X2 [Microplitis mediator]|uniref:hypodermin-B-like isoform X2 n=1 Tax=Microplitis mediator TaxID=375433 RepID=UPI0025528957|nr:hypodermin-B-like isoform X2 [Microplitis mediator]